MKEKLAVRSRNREFHVQMSLLSLNFTGTIMDMIAVKHLLLKASEGESIVFASFLLCAFIVWNFTDCSCARLVILFCCQILFGIGHNVIFFFVLATISCIYFRYNFSNYSYFSLDVYDVHKVSDCFSNGFTAN